MKVDLTKAGGFFHPEEESTHLLRKKHLLF